MMTGGLKTTPLHQWHIDSNANMADFGGYDMPLWYETGVKNEHLAVLSSAGIFDTSHMACISLEGSDAFNLLNFCFTRDISDLNTGRCVYGAFLDERGHCIDDAIVYKFSPIRFMVCVNAGMGSGIASHLTEQAGDKDVGIKDLSGKLAKMDIQGKNSARILAKCLMDPDKVLSSMPYFSFKGDLEILSSESGNQGVSLKDGTRVLLSRSGYTGEFGFEIFLAPSAIKGLWTDILAAGEPYGIKACGLGARDSLRVGACLPLSHQDIGDWPFKNHPWDFALPYSPDHVGFTKTFLGDLALLEDSPGLFVFPYVGENLRKVNAGENTQVLDEEGNSIGRVLTCATDMGISWKDGQIVSVNSPEIARDFKIKGISCGFVMVSKALEPGRKLTLKEGKRSIKVIVSTDMRPDRTARLALKNFI